MKKVIVGVMLISALVLAGCKIDNREMPSGGKDKETSTTQ